MKKSQQARTLSLREEMVLRSHRIHARWKRAGYGWPGQAYRRVKAFSIVNYRRARRLLGASASTTTPA